MNAVCEWDVAIWVKELRRACVMIIEGDRAALRMNKGVLRSWRSSERLKSHAEELRASARIREVRRILKSDVETASARISEVQRMLRSRVEG